MKNFLILLSVLLLSFQVQAALVSGGVGGEIIAAVSIQEDSPTNTHQQGFNEVQGLVLGSDIDIDGGTIAAGTRVDSHIIFLNSLRTRDIDQRTIWSLRRVNLKEYI